MVDEARFESVYATYAPVVSRYCAYSTGSRHTAEDLTAETFARFLVRGEPVADDIVERWLLRVARNLCASHHRSTTRSRRFLARLAESEPTAAVSATADAWPYPDAWRYVRPLKEAQRLAIYLRVVEDRPFAEVARTLGVSESAAKMTYYRAVERVRRDMEHDAPGLAQQRLRGAEND
jgi:RNA polymerase sigma-70 factor (ECF subfamily)